MQVERRVLVLHPAKLRAEEHHVHVHQRTVNSVDSRIREDRRRARLAAILRRQTPLSGQPVGAFQLAAAEVHAPGQVLAGHEVHEVQPAVHLIFVVVGDGRRRAEFGLRLRADGCEQAGQHRCHCNLLHHHPEH